MSRLSRVLDRLAISGSPDHECPSCGEVKWSSPAWDEDREAYRRTCEECGLIIVMGRA